MKKLAYFMAMASIVFFSCQPAPIAEETKGIVLSIQKEGKKVETSSIDFIGEGGTIDVGLSCKGDWTVNAAPSSWLSVNPTSGTGEATLSVKALVNTDSDSRLGAVIVTCGDENTTLTVTQSGTWLVLSADSLSYGSTGGSDTLTISSNVAWEVSTSESWLTFSAPSGKGDGILVVTASDNASTSSRTGIVTITSDGYSLPVTIVQDARYLSIDTEVIHFANEGGRYEVAVDDDGTFDASADVDWLSFEKQEKGFTVIAAENANPNSRRASITVFLSDLTEGTLERNIKVSQDSRYLKIGTSSIHFVNAGGRSESISVDCNGVFDVRSDVDWLTFEKQDSSFIAIATDNATPYNRYATVTVYLSDLTEGTLERRINVSQDSRYLNVGSSSISFANEGGRSEAVAVDCNGVFDVRSDGDWLTFEKQDGVFIAIATDNATPYSRDATVTVYLSDLTEGTLERTISVSQESRYLNVGTKKVSFDIDGGRSETITIDSNGKFDVRSEVDWLSFEKDVNSFIIIATNNDTPYSRKATVTVFLVNLTDGVLEQKIGITQNEILSGTENGHNWVNLGLPSGTLWATEIVRDPSTKGHLFKWGDKTGLDPYDRSISPADVDWSTYKWCKGTQTTLTKYNTKSSFGTVDNNTVLTLHDDAAHVHWGGKWRIPTQKEWEELNNPEYCSWTWDNQVDAIKVISQVNGNSLIISEGGYLYDLFEGAMEEVPWTGHYWSSTLDENNPDKARSFYFVHFFVDNNVEFQRSFSTASRCNALQIKPVCSWLPSDGEIQ